MVIMEDYFPHEKYRELWLKIDQLHLGYLEMEESTEKIMHRTKLEECIAEFLFLAQHRDKFVFSETEDILYRSAASKKDFSAYKAATGWNALQIYASNLLTQPWRKEYRQIKTYCGFYKHQIEANLISAETIFETMGYKFVGNGILILEGPVCPDRVSNVSRDCLVAYVECQILKHIWEEVPPVFKINWLDILDYRIKYPGDLEHCIKNIKYKYNSKQFQPPVRGSRIESYETRHQPSSPTGQMSVANSHRSVPNSHSYAALASHNHVALPGVIVPPVPYCVPHTNGCLNNFAPYGYGTYPAHMPIIKQPLPVTVPNGYYYPNAMAVPQAMYAVPTAQLIELEGRNGYDMVDEGPPARARRSRIDSNGTLESDRVYKNDVGASQDVKQEVEEDWDYVYRDLEKQGYSKDLGERGDVLVLANSDKQRKSSRESKKVKATNLDDVMNSLTVSDRPLKMTEALEHLEKKPERIVQTKERRHSQGSSYENVNPNEPLKQVKTTLRTPHTSLTQTQSLKEAEVNKPKNTLIETNKTKGEEKESLPKWECKSCTYLNDLSKDICEICSKSRSVVKEQPMEVGGPECSKCTLVNPRSEKKCQACGTCLKNSPTYI